MSLKRWNGSSMIDLSTLKRWDGTAMVDLTIAKRWDGTSFVDLGLTGPGTTVSVTTDKASVSSVVFGGGLAVDMTSPAVTATTTGGTGPYTYLWTRVSGSYGITCNYPTSPNTSFSANVPRDQGYTTVFQVVATDSLGATDTALVTVTLDHETTEMGGL